MTLEVNGFRDSANGLGCQPSKVATLEFVTPELLILARILIDSAHRLPALFMLATTHQHVQNPSPTRTLCPDPCANFPDGTWLHTMLFDPRPLARAASVELDPDTVRHRDSGMFDLVIKAWTYESCC